MLVVDVREREPAFLPENGGADAREFLAIGFGNYSCDFEIRLPFKAGQEARTLRVERKRFSDFVGSFLADDKLARQCSYVNILVVEFDPTDVEATQTRYTGDPRDPVGRAMKRLARMCANEGEYARLHVIPTLGPEGTIAALRYVESGKATRKA